MEPDARARIITPSGGYRGNDVHRCALPLLLYPEQRVFDGSFRGGASLLSYLPPFHDGISVYDCPFEPAFIQKRNERERQRVKCVNAGYAKLREHLPSASAEKRLSKVETLRAAIRYIKYLQSLVDSRERAEESRERASPLSNCERMESAGKTSV